MPSTMTRLVGQELLEYIASNEASMSKTQQCLGAGYVRYSDGIGYPEFTDFYTAVIDARGIERDIKDAERKVECADWYENLTDQDQDLYDAICERYSDIDRLDANECQEFMDVLSEHGITTGDQFRDAHYYSTSSWNPEQEFAQMIAEEVNCVDLDSLGYLVIDWQATWDSALCYDFFTIKFDGETFFFSNNF